MGFLNIGKIHRAHQERSQPSSRQKFGLLEKHKDYVVRARNFNQKQKTLHNLRRKAAFKNPDEFYFRMINSKTHKGVHKDTKAGTGTAASRSTTHSSSLLKMYNSDDLKYLHHCRQKEMAKINKLRECLHEISSSSGKAEKIVYLDNEEQLEEISAMYSSDEEEEEDDNEEVVEEEASTEAGRQYRELNIRQERLNTINQLIEKLQTQKNLMGKGACEKVKDFKDKFGDPDPTRPSIFKWKQERKK